jgi:hypothetical protein
MRTRAFPACVCCLLAVATARASDEAAAPAAAAEASTGWPSTYFPLASGMRWTYRERTGPFGGRRVMLTAEDRRPVRGSRTPLFVVREEGEGSFFGIEDSGLLGFAVEGDFVIRFSAVGEDSRGELRLFGEEGLRILPREPEDGQHWEQEWHLFSVHGSQGAARSLSARVSRVASVTVPAGRFEDVVEVEMQYRDPAVSQDRPQLSFEDYYAAGVGLVKSVSHDHEGGFWRKVTRVLESYDPPGDRADSR